MQFLVIQMQNVMKFVIQTLNDMIIQGLKSKNLSINNFFQDLKSRDDLCLMHIS